MTTVNYVNVLQSGGLISHSIPDLILGITFRISFEQSCYLRIFSTFLGFNILSNEVAKQKSNRLTWTPFWYIFKDSATGTSLTKIIIVCHFLEHVIMIIMIIPSLLLSATRV